MNISYQEMEEVAFTAYQDMTIHPGYQETMTVSTILPVEGMVLLEPGQGLASPLTGHAVRHRQHGQPVRTKRTEGRCSHIQMKTDENRPLHGIQH